MGTGTCRFCWSLLIGETFTTKCGHTFHNYCLATSTCKNCPICQSELQIFEYTADILTTDTAFDFELNVPCVLKSVLENDIIPLIFTDFDCAIFHAHQNKFGFIPYDAHISLIPSRAVISTPTLCALSFDGFVEFQKISGIITYHLPTIEVNIHDLSHSTTETMRIIHNDDCKKIIQFENVVSLFGLTKPSRHLAFFSDNSVGAIVDTLVDDMYTNLYDVPIVPLCNAADITDFRKLNNISWHKLNDGSYIITKHIPH